MICLGTVTAVIQRALTPLSNDSTGIPREHADGLLLILELELVPIVVEVLLCTTTTVHYYLQIVVVVVLPLLPLPLPTESANGFLLILELEPIWGYLLILERSESNTWQKNTEIQILGKIQKYEDSRSQLKIYLSSCSYRRWGFWLIMELLQ